MIKFYLLTCLLFIHVLLYAQPMKLDKTFGKNGICLDTTGTEIYTFDFDTSGSIVAAGYYQDTVSTWYTLLSKYSKDGSIDSSFGINGIAKAKFGEQNIPYGIAIQPDNKILVVGDYDRPAQPAGPGGYCWYMARYHSNGTPDSSFGQYGLVKANYSPTSLFRVNCLPGNKIIAAGASPDTCFLIRLNADGSPDNTFGTNGRLNVGDTSLSISLWIFMPLSDGNFLIGGADLTQTNNPRVAVAKIDSNGSWVSSFGNDGKLIIDLYNPGSQYGSETFMQAVELPNGKILLSGYDTTGIFLKINSDGTPDSSFGVNGIARTELVCRDFTVQPDGKIVKVSSEIMSQYNYGYSFSRLDTNGNPDLSFNNIGDFNVDISPGSDYVQCIRMQEGKIIAGGSSEPNDHWALTLVRLDLDTGLSVKTTTAQNHIRVYPNPSDGNITIKGPSANAQIDVFSMNGQKVYSTAIRSNNEHLTLPLPDGVYLLKYTTNETTEIQRLIIYH